MTCWFHVAVEEVCELEQHKGGRLQTRRFCDIRNT